MATGMERFALTSTAQYNIGIVFVGLMTCFGCGSGTEIAKTPVQTSVQETNTSLATDISSPMDVVSQFLDEVRRGGDDSRANSLLTQQAQQELGQIGQSIQPIGSPAARFDVTRSELVPGEQDSALVHSVWSEPNQDGTTNQYQVVWAMQRESSGWRISGLAMELDPNQPLMIIDFENSEMMAKLLTPNQPARSSTQAQASGPSPSNPAVSR